jgi:hypothetical protein
MLILVLPLFFQLGATEPQVAQGPSAPPAAESGQAKPAEPEVVCTMEPITGTRARKMRVCRTKSYEKAGERARDTMEIQQRMGGGTAPPGAPG